MKDKIVAIISANQCEGKMKTKEIEKQKSSLVLDLVHKFAISPEDTQAIVKNYQSRYKAKYPNVKHEVMQNYIAKRLIKKYAKLCGAVGAASALTGVVPGLGTALAAIGGTATDVVVCMKLEVDMCMCLAQNYDWDINTEEARHLIFLIAAGTTLEKLGTETSSKIASKAGVKLLQKYLKGATLKITKELFKKIGVTFTRKALVKIIPFGFGVIFGGTANYYLTKYVGKQANKWFIIERDERT